MDIQTYMDANRETVLDQLLHFESEKRSPGADAIPESLEKYLEFIAKTGDTLFPWHKVRPLIKKKVEIVIEEFYKQHPNVGNGTPNVPTFNFEEMKNELVESVDSFYGAPFTIQRICELLTVPYKHYRRTDKFMRGLEKNILVVSYVEPRGAGDEASPPPQKNSIFSTPAYHPFSNSPSSSGYVSNGGAGTSGIYGAHHSKSGISGPSSPPSDAPAPLAQLDSFTTVFSSPPSTPLAVVSDMPPYEPSSSSSSSSGSSAESSPLGPADASPPPSGHFVNETFSDDQRKETEGTNESPAPVESVQTVESVVPVSEVNIENPTDAPNKTSSEEVVPVASLPETDGALPSANLEKVESLPPIELATEALLEQATNESVSLTVLETQKVELIVEVVPQTEPVPEVEVPHPSTDTLIEEPVAIPDISLPIEQPRLEAGLEMETEGENVSPASAQIVDPIRPTEQVDDEEDMKMTPTNTDSHMSESDDSEPMDED